MEGERRKVRGCVPASLSLCAARLSEPKQGCGRKVPGHLFRIGEPAPFLVPIEKKLFSAVLPFPLDAPSDVKYSRGPLPGTEGLV